MTFSTDRADAFSMVDASTLLYGKALTEAFTVADAYSTLVGKALADTTLFSDTTAFSIQLALSDTISFADAVTFGEPANDYNEYPIDTSTFSDSGVANLQNYTAPYYFEGDYVGTNYNF